MQTIDKQNRDLKFYPNLSKNTFNVYSDSKSVKLNQDRVEKLKQRTRKNYRSKSNFKTEEFKFPDIKTQTNTDFKLRTVASLRGNLDPAKLEEFYYQVDSVWPALGHSDKKKSGDIDNNSEKNEKAGMTNSESISRTLPTFKMNTYSVTQQQFHGSYTVTKTTMKNTAATSEWGKRSLKDLTTLSDKENLLKEQDLGIDWENQLKEGPNIIDNFRSLIKAAEIQLKMLIIDNKDLKHHQLFLGQQRDQVEIINIKMSHKVQYRKNDQSVMRLHEEQLKDSNQEYTENLSKLKIESERAHEDLGRTAREISHQDNKHEASMKLYMQEINDEKDEFGQYTADFIEQKKSLVKFLEELKLKEKTAKDRLDDYKRVTNEKKALMNKAADKLIKDTKIEFEKMDKQKMDIRQNRLYDNLSSTYDQSCLVTERTDRGLDSNRDGGHTERDRRAEDDDIRIVSEEEHEDDEEEDQYESSRNNIADVKVENDGINEDNNYSVEL